MKWTEYPTDLEFREGRNGTLREGQIWANAPGPSSWWVIPAGGGGEAVLVKERRGRMGKEKRSIACGEET
jgi:hypothetical protein